MNDRALGHNWSMFTLYNNTDSGNAYKIRLALTQLKLPFRCIELDTTAGETRTADFLNINPNGRIPVLETEDGRRLAESNAILFALAQGTPLWPEQKWDQATTLQWMFFEQYSHEPFIAVLRNWAHTGRLKQFHAQLDAKKKGGEAALAVMEHHLQRHHYFSGENYGIGDISLYAYTHVAQEGGFDLSLYPKINAWLRRVEGQESYIPLQLPPE